MGLNTEVALLFLLFAALSIVEPLSETIADDIEVCRQEHNLTQEDLERMRNKEMPETLEGKCFLECVMNKVDLMSGDRLNPEGAKGMIAELEDVPQEEKEKLAQVVDECNNQIEYKEDEECENGIIVSKCISEKATEKGIQPPESV